MEEKSTHIRYLQMVRGAATLPNGSGKVCSSLSVEISVNLSFQDIGIYVYFLLYGSSHFFFMFLMLP